MQVMVSRKKWGRRIQPPCVPLNVLSSLRFDEKFSFLTCFITIFCTFEDILIPKNLSPDSIDRIVNKVIAYYFTGVLNESWW